MLLLSNASVLLTLTCFLLAAIACLSIGEKVEKNKTSVKNLATSGKTVVTKKSSTNKVLLKLEPTSVIHMWMRPKSKGHHAKVSVRVGKTNTLVAETNVFRTDPWFDFYELRSKDLAGLHQQTDEEKVSDALMSGTKESKMVKLVWNTKTTDVSYIYVYEPETVLKEGIRQKYIWDQAKHPNFTGSYHFRTPVGWINDPSGFSIDQDGRYHLMYQHYPSKNHWHAMHWGHAVSDDLINWTNLPVILRPPAEGTWGGEYGHFSGSAIAVPGGGMGLFWTERTHLSPRRWLRKNAFVKEVTDQGFPLGVKLDFKEVQQCAYVPDNILPDPKSKKVVIAAPPKDAVWDDQRQVFGPSFRDPQVFLGPKGHYYITLGAEADDGSGGMILLYKKMGEMNADKLCEGWEFQSVLHKDGRDKLKMAECAALVPLGDIDDPETYWILIYTNDKGTWTYRTTADAEGREHVPTLVVGKFDGKQFIQLEGADRLEQKLEYSGGSYAYQAIYDPKKKRTFAIGWLFDGDVTLRSDITCFTMVKEIKLVQDELTGKKHLTMGPLKEYRQLRTRQKQEQQINLQQAETLRSGEPIKLSKGTVEFFLEFDWSTHQEFELELLTNHKKPHGEAGKPLTIHISTTKGIEIKKHWVQEFTETMFELDEQKRLWETERTVMPKRMVVPEATRVQSLRIFVDLDCVEVFADEGRWTFAMRVHDTDTKRHISQARVTKSGALANIMLYTLDYSARKFQWIHKEESEKLMNKTKKATKLSALTTAEDGQDEEDAVDDYDKKDEEAETDDDDEQSESGGTTDDEQVTDDEEEEESANVAGGARPPSGFKKFAEQKLKASAKEAASSSSSKIVQQQVAALKETAQDTAATAAGDSDESDSLLYNVMSAKNADS